MSAMTEVDEVDERRLLIEVQCRSGCPNHRPGEWHTRRELPPSTTIESGADELERQRAEFPKSSYRLVKIHRVHKVTREVLA